MQTVPSWPTSLDVTTPAARVAVAGVEREVSEVSVQQELGGSLPGQVVGGSGITAATGSIGWAEGDDVQELPALPWLRQDGWPPSPGQSCEIQMGYGSALAMQLTGVLTDTAGSFGSVDLSTGVEDRIAKLNRLLTIDPLLAIMPPVDNTAYQIPRYISLHSIYYVDRVLRACGFYATPKPMTNAVISAPMNGSVWPEIGQCTQAVSTISGAAFPRWTNAPWGLHVQDASARYTPTLPAGVSGRLVRPFEMAYFIEDGNTTLTALWGDVGYRIAVTETTITAQRVAGGGTSTVNLNSVPRSGTRQVVLRVTPNSGQVTCELRTEVAQSSGTTSLVVGADTTPLSQLWVAGPGEFAGVQAGFPDSAFETLTHVSSAILQPPASAANRNQLVGMPAIINRTGLNVLREIADAECAAMWIDAAGVFRWRDRTRLPGEVAVVLTSADNLFDVTWEDSAAHVRSRVNVMWKMPAVTRSPFHTVTVYQGTGETLQSDEAVDTQIVHPGADEAWVMVDTGVSLTWETLLDDFNRGKGTWMGGVLDNGTDPDVGGNSYLSGSVQRIDANSYLITHTVTGTLPSGRELQLRTSSNTNSPFWGRWRNQPLPLLRAKALLTGTDTATVGSPAGPSGAEELTHEAGWWIQDAAYAQQTANYLAAQTVAPTPIIRSLDIVPDPRIELADTVAVDDRTRSGMYLICLVAGYNVSVSDGQMSHSLTVRVSAAQGRHPTVGDFDQVWAGGDVAEFDTHWAGHTVAEFDADPLNR